MANVSIPLTLDTGAPPFEFTTELDGVAYILLVEYNARDESWFLSISDEDGALLVGAQPLIEEWPLLSRHKALSADLPQGDLYIVGQTLVYSEAAS